MRNKPRIIAFVVRDKVVFPRSQEITKRAIAESGIRQALMDLEIWESTASLPLQESTDIKNLNILLVGDYGSVLTKIGATCSVLTVTCVCC